MVNYMQENNRNELERLDKERHDDFLSMLKGFVVNQVFLPPLCSGCYKILRLCQSINS